jgi:hypothetical protein
MAVAGNRQYSAIDALQDRTQRIVALADSWSVIYAILRAPAMPYPP